MEEDTLKREKILPVLLEIVLTEGAPAALSINESYLDSMANHHERSTDTCTLDLHLQLVFARDCEDRYYTVKVSEKGHVIIPRH